MGIQEQNYQNHVRRDLLYGLAVLPILGLNLVFCAVHFARARDWFSGWLLVLAVGLIVLALKTRLYPLRVQDRVIRLEERLRLTLLLPPELRSRIPEFSDEQLIALRFAADEELPGLAAQALNGRWGSKEIKRRIERWRPDHLRV